MGTLRRSSRLAAVMVFLLLVSILLMIIMPAESDELADRAITYASFALFMISIALVGGVIYLRRREPAKMSPAGGSPADDDGEYEDEVSEIEREFEALEKEIEREERG